MNQDSTAVKTKPHYPILDGLRGIAAIMVVAFHIFEGNASGKHDQIINHGYLAVDFFFALSGFVIGYAYDDRWGKLTVGGFFKRRIERLQPMVVLGMVSGAIGFYATDSAMFPLVHTVPLWKVIAVMIIGFTLVPLPASWGIRGWSEMHPLNGPGWSLFYEYLANFLYAAGMRKLSNKALGAFAAIAAIVLAHYLLTEKGDVIGGWSLDAEQIRIGLTRLLYPFFAGLLLCRTIRTGKVPNAFLISALMLCAILCMPRFGGENQPWINGLYEAASIIFLFPFIIYIGASGTLKGRMQVKICKFLGDISYPIYITHFAFVYIYWAWISDHKNAAFSQNLLYGMLTFTASIALGYVSLKYYDEPVRAWLKRRWK